MLTCGAHLRDMGFTEKVLVDVQEHVQTPNSMSTHPLGHAGNFCRPTFCQQVAGVKLRTPAVDFVPAANNFQLNDTEFSISFLPLSFSCALLLSHSIS